ncbi:cysteine--tRNA ligase [Parvularcula lutaonensis]|uniref:Cysteine--tRNA ligase n=1 Tax=Parvularcula lutaonensis TaxID=491923 RepID=A0ABV7MG10_9PROT|nr:cysteine--tRNA ligase [Parvularcula lutaonensis]GGY53440.1 cysteine--tRNA ligase [Parvularcula lutaonensis]
MSQKIHVHDTFRGEKVEFRPAQEERVTVYCCGPTVYAPPHIGNARAGVVADQMVRLLREVYGEKNVVYARNLTDIDDKIIAAANEEGVDIEIITARATEAYLSNLEALGCDLPDMMPKATGHIDAMQSMVTSLLEQDFAYVAEDHVLFDTQAFPGYGSLSRLNRDDIIAGARVEVAPYKRDPADFVLWKPAKEGEPGWDAPEAWGIEGKGRPGWHLECSAMIEENLRAPIDLHLGGLDLRFPHHENEIAQSCCATDLGGVPLARHWMHNGMLRMGDTKMSKSLGNIVTPTELLEEWHGEVLRMALLSAQYRQPLEWSDQLLEASKAQLDKFYRAAGDAEPGDVPSSVLEALSDDLNTPAAFAAMHELRERAQAGDAEAKSGLRAAGRLLGLMRETEAAWFKGGASADDARIDALLAERAAARAAKNFARADEIRDQLSAEGIIIEDNPGGATWRRG